MIRLFKLKKFAILITGNQKTKAVICKNVALFCSYKKYCNFDFLANNVFCISIFPESIFK